MLFRSYSPPPPLGDFVQDFWLYQGYAPSHFKERILPSATFELVVNLKDDELRIYDPRRPERFARFPGALVSGPYGEFFVTDTEEEASVMGVHFKPGGAFPFLGVSADAIGAAHVDLGMLWGRRAQELRERLCLASTPGERFKVLEDSLRAHLFRPLAQHPAVSAGLAALGQAGACTRIREFAREIGLSQRRVINVFREQIGMAPKLFSRIQRFHRALALARRAAAPDWAELALHCGYFDQSHMIRDFVVFSGCSPAEYLCRYAELRQKAVPVKRNHLPLLN